MLSATRIRDTTTMHMIIFSQSEKFPQQPKIAANTTTFCNEYWSQWLLSKWLQRASLTQPTEFLGKDERRCGSWQSRILPKSNGNKSWEQSWGNESTHEDIPEWDKDVNLWHLFCWKHQSDWVRRSRGGGQSRGDNGFCGIRMVERDLVVCCAQPGCRGPCCSNLYYRSSVLSS